MFKLMTQQVRRFARNSLVYSKSAAEQSAAAPAKEEELEKWAKKLRKAGVGDVDFNLKCLVAHVLNIKFSSLSDYKNAQLNDAQWQDFERLCEARCARMPLQHIVGEWDFMDLTLKTSPNVFIPRPETEEFVSKVIEAHRNAPSFEMLEVGCGSGAISLAMLHKLPQVKADAIERSKAATALAWENAKLLGMQGRFTVYNHTMEKDCYLPGELINKSYDLIVSNPPYVKSEEFPLLQPEVVAYENLNALDGGPDGLRVARLVLNLACEHLKPNGKLWLELGNDHPQMMKTVINTQYEGKLHFVASYYDQYKRERFVEIEKASKN